MLAMRVVGWASGQRGTLWGLPFLTPAAEFVLFVILVPSSQGVMYAFTDWVGLTPVWKCIGFAELRAAPQPPTRVFSAGPHRGSDHRNCSGPSTSPV
jgi:ABC-type sugar transport system permease subunit